MSHGLTTRDGMFTVREPAWHGLGITLPDYPTLEQAVVAASQAWNPVKVPVYVQDAAGAFVEAPNHAAIVRDDMPLVLSVMSNKYEPLTNERVHRIVERYKEQGGVVLTTGGTLDDGRKCWMLLESGDGIAIPGDDSIVQGYLLLSWSHDGTTPLTVRNVFIRVVCQNTFHAALATSVASFRVKHTKGAPARVDAYEERVAALADDLRAFGDMAAMLSAAPFGKDDWRTLADALFPLPTDDDGKVLDGIRTERAFEAQDTLLALRGNATVADAMGDTAWGAWNAAVEVYDHLLGVEVAPDKRNLTPEAGYRRTLGGERDEQKRHALTVVSSIAGVA